MRALTWLLVGFAVLGISSAQAQTRLTQPEAPAWSEIGRFSSDAEFQRYLRDVRDAARRARAISRGKQATPEECPPEFEPCVVDEQIVVTGSRLSAAPPSPPPPAPSVQQYLSSLPQVTGNVAPDATSITNVQNLGVDEGDIVKLYRRFLIVLQDGRLFSVDTGAAPGALALVDRINVYRARNRGVWYDEILIADNRVVVTGFNYGQNATEFSVFSISPQGRFTRESTYFLSSDDYYDTENYASRLVNGNLVIYTPLAVHQAAPTTRFRWPLVRRWLSESERETQTTQGRQLFEARDIHRPIQATFDPVVHTISVCPLGSARGGDELECRSTALIGPPGREFYVSTSHIYIWTYPTYNGAHRAFYEERCEGRANGFDAAAPAALFQIPLEGGSLRAQYVRGRPYDQLSMDASATEFRALDVWQDLRCITWNNAPEQLPLRYLATPLSAFSDKPRPLAEARYTNIPSVGAAIENRFTESHLIYSGRPTYDSYAPEPGAAPLQDARIAIIPTARPRDSYVLESPHSALRVERVGNNAIVTGYRDARGLQVSLVDLSRTPRIASTVLLPDRFESEGRSHAFNAAIDPDGSGLMGLPTVMRRAESGRWWWRSRGSDVSFLALQNGRLSDQGHIRGTSPRLPGYTCEVSCIDWYGNTRALFIAGRIFALSGTELVEGVLSEEGIRDLARVNLTSEPPRQ